MSLQKILRNFLNKLSIYIHLYLSLECKIIKMQFNGELRQCHAMKNLFIDYFEVIYRQSTLDRIEETLAINVESSAVHSGFKTLD